LSNERLSIGRDCALLQRPGLDALVPASSLELIAEASLQCERGSACVVPPGQTRILRHSLDVQTLEVKGTLRWDTSKDNLELRTNYLLVTGQGARFEIGSEESPMELRATVFIKGSRMEDPDCGRRFVCGKDGAHISMHGRPLRKTWTLLAADAPAGETTIRLKDDPLGMGWRVGDQIAIATTGRDSSFLGRIESIGHFSVTLASNLENHHLGGFTEYRGRRFEMAAEVTNLERSVLVTGDHEHFHAAPFQDALHVMQMGSGVMQVSYSRVEWCGQRDILGRYCLHFHLMGWCEDCYFKGNAVFESNQVGITIHGTHGTRVEENVLWNARAVGIYTEDGNEMQNRIAYNAVICQDLDECHANWQEFRGPGEAMGGIYMIGMTNDVIGNHVAGHVNGAWFNGAARPNGHGSARGRVCTVHQPFGRVQGNVFHDNARFGMYPDNQHPRNIKVDMQTGYVIDRSTCDPFLPDGTDNGADEPSLIEDEFDWHNVFVGQYDVGDIRWVRYTGVDNGHSMYWKSSKNFKDGSLHHIVDSVFLTLPATVLPKGVGKTCLSILLAGGPFTFGLRNVTLLGGPTCNPGVGALKLGQHCGHAGSGSPCNTQYLFDQVRFDLEPGEAKVRFHVNNADPGAEVTPVLISRAGDDSLDGWRSIVSPHLDGFARESGCEKLGREWAYGYGCSFAVRRLNIWPLGSARNAFGHARHMQDLELSGPGYSASPHWADPVKGQNAGRMLFSPLHRGFGMPVVVGREYTLRVTTEVGNPVIELSDTNLNRELGTDDGVTLRIVGGASPGSCNLRGLAARPWMNVLSGSGLYSEERLQGGCLAASAPGGASAQTSTPSGSADTCGLPCWYKSVGHSCEGRVRWLVDNTASTRAQAVDVVNEECSGQCQCASTAAPAPTSPTSAPPAPSPVTTPAPAPQPSPSLPTPQPADACSLPCTYNGVTHSCQGRIGWLVDNTEKNLDEATELVNRECRGQCSCVSRMDGAGAAPSQGTWVRYNKNCYGNGHGADYVLLPGHTGLGDGAHVPGLTLDQCRGLCASTAGCTAIAMSQQSGRCYGRTNVDISQCDTGGYFTETYSPVQR
jgi:hypothetical protein